MMGNVVELVGIISVVVKFLGSIVINNEPPVAVANRVVSCIRRSDCWLYSGLFRVTELRNKRDALEFWVHRQLAKFYQGGIDVDQAGGFRARVAGLDAWPRKYQWNSC